MLEEKHLIAAELQLMKTVLEELKAAGTFFEALTEYSVFDGNFKSGLDMAENAMRKRIDKGKIMNKPIEYEIGERTQCNQCGDQIQWNGDFWQHIKFNSNHAGIPKKEEAGKIELSQKEKS